MNIEKAKDQVKKAIECYLTKDEFGRYEIPQKEQRPVFLMGPPGIGKTDIMAQIASEMGIGLLTYSMTHHTRQSAIGLPIIVKKTYQGKEVTVSEYSMSEIISSIYEMIEKTGQKTGILFLDEINCVSETLSPIMLQFLQYKRFGNDTVPEGWIVVTAGNPPEYNNSVHEFDIVTWDRLKRIDIEPDFEIWKVFAYDAGVHPSIITYLETKKSNFYHIEQTVDGKSFVTARGWTDLSKMLTLYEKHGFDVDKDLIGQYIHDEKIARDYSVYYDLYKKYKSDYHVSDIINGTWSDEILERTENAPYDEKFALTGLLIEAMGDDAKRIVKSQTVLQAVRENVLSTKTSKDVVGDLEKAIAEIEQIIGTKKNANSLSQKEYDEELMKLQLLKKYVEEARKRPDDPYEAAKEEFNKDASTHKKDCEIAQKHFSNIFNFGDEAFGKDSQQMLIICTEMVASSHISRYISLKSSQCKEYFEHDELLMFHKRNVEIIKELGELEDLTEI